MNTDERRAGAILPDYQKLVLCGDDKCASCLHACEIFARAIRASDEEAGMVLVPREHIVNRDWDAVARAMLAAGGGNADV